MRMMEPPLTRAKQLRSKQVLYDTSLCSLASCGSSTLTGFVSRRAQETRQQKPQILSSLELQMVLCWSRSSVVTECFLSSWCLLLTRFTSIEGGRIVSTSSVEDVFFSSSYKVLKDHLNIRMPSIHFSCAQSYCLLSLLCHRLHGLAYLFKWENQQCCTSTRDLSKDTLLIG